MPLRFFAVGAGMLLSVALLLAGSDDTAHDGILVSFRDSEMVIADRLNHEHVLTLAEHANVTIDGKRARPRDLKVGMGLRAMTDRTAPETAIRVAARSRE